jgi:acylphosphatase
MDFDLNIEAVVEGDDEALNDFNDMLENAHDHG